MIEADEIIKYLLESDEEDDDEGFETKELVEPGDEVVAGPTTVKRFGRMKLVDMPRYVFLISYLTPVAYFDKLFKTYYETTKQWSPTTDDHIKVWQSMIWKSPEWQADEKNWEPSDVIQGNHWVRYPKFKRKRQSVISGLFRELMLSMEMKPHQKRRLYHVDPKMRKGAAINKTWMSAHLKHHPTGAEGLPSPGQERRFEPFFKDFDPHKPEEWSWEQTGYRPSIPRERYQPDE